LQSPAAIRVFAFSNPTVELSDYFLIECDSYLSMLAMMSYAFNVQ